MTYYFFLLAPYMVMSLCLLTAATALALALAFDSGSIITAIHSKAFSALMYKRAQLKSRVAILLGLLSVIMAFWAGTML